MLFRRKRGASARQQSREAAERRIGAELDAIDAWVEAGNAATVVADGVAVRLALGLASDVEVRAALDVDVLNPYANTGGLVTQCVLEGRWDLVS
jgi:hypothetical protein